MTDQTLAALLESGSYAVLTANEPRHDTLSGGNAALRADLESLGYQVIPCYGVYQGTPDGESFLVPRCDRDVALLLGRAYGQHEVLIPEGSAECSTGLVAPWTGEVFVGQAARDQDYHTVLPSGLAFSLGLDFETQRIPLDTIRGRRPETVGAAHIYARSA